MSDVDHIDGPPTGPGDLEKVLARVHLASSSVGSCSRKVQAISSAAGSLAVASRSSSRRSSNRSRSRVDAQSAAGSNQPEGAEHDARRRWAEFPEAWCRLSPNELKVRQDDLRTLTKHRVRNWVSWLVRTAVPSAKWKTALTS